jgi:prepilin-type N-terminal cleavage/methylation domain-containing protein
MHITRRRPAAFTIVELLVVIAIIGLLVALLMPAIQQAREAGRRSQCSNNLHEIGLGYASYESAHQCLPPAYISDPTKAVGWGVFILPHIERLDLFKQYNFKVPFYYSAAGVNNQQIANTPIEVFRCPSAPIKDAYTYTFNYPGYPSITWQASPADYSPIARIAPELDTYLSLNYSADQRKGALEPDRTMPVHLISDGASHTILLAEMAGKNDLWQNGRLAGGQLTGQYGGQGGWADPTSAASVFVGSSYDGTTAPGPSGINSSNDYGIYSFHRIVANTLLADGSVQSLSADVDIRVVVGLITRAGGELEDIPQ